MISSKSPQQYLNENKNLIYHTLLLSDGYTLYQTLIGSWGFWSFWGVNQHSTTNGSGDIRIGDFLPFWHFFLKNGHFRGSDRYTLYQTLIGSWDFWSFWGVNQPSTTNGSGDIELGIFWPFLTLFGQKRALPVIWWVYIILNTDGKPIFPIKMRGLPCSYDKRFRRYRFGEFRAFLAQKGPERALPVIWKIGIQASSVCSIVIFHFQSRIRIESHMFGVNYATYRCSMNSHSSCLEFWLI